MNNYLTIPTLVTVRLKHSVSYHLLNLFTSPQLWLSQIYTSSHLLFIFRNGKGKMLTHLTHWNDLWPLFEIGKMVVCTMTTLYLNSIYLPIFGSSSFPWLIKCTFVIYSWANTHSPLMTRKLDFYYPYVWNSASSFALMPDSNVKVLPSCSEFPPTENWITFCTSAKGEKENW